MKQITYDRDYLSATWQISRKRCTLWRTTTAPYISTRSPTLPRSYKNTTPLSLN